jgi:hypothetical protein
MARRRRKRLPALHGRKYGGQHQTKGCNPLGQPAADPCPYAPGTKERLAWLRRRAKRGLALWRKGDATFDNYTLPPGG